MFLASYSGLFKTFVVVPTGVFAASEDFGDTSNGRLAQRIDRAAGEFADPTPFAELLSRKSGS